MVLKDCPMCAWADAKPEENSSNKSPFQLFCVCSVILSVNSAFQRPVLGMSMRKMTMNYTVNDDYKFSLFASLLFLLGCFKFNCNSSCTKKIIIIKIKTSFEKSNE